MSRKDKVRLAAACAAALLISQSAHATDYTWTNATDGNWTDTPNWTPNTGVPLAGDTATFNADGVNGAENIYLNGNQAATSLTFNNTGATTLNTGVSGTPVNNQTLTLSGGITVASTAGQVNIGSGTTNNVSIFANGSINIVNNGPSGVANRLNFDNGGTTSFTSIESVPTGNNVVTTSGTGDILFIGSFRNNTVNGNIGLVINSAGFVELDGSSSQFGLGTVLNSGTLGVKSSNALGTNATSFTLNGGTYESVGSGRTLPAGVSVTFGGDVTLGTTAVSGMGGLANTFAGSVTLAGKPGDPTAADTLTLSNSNTWKGTASGTGGITIQNTLAGNPATTLNMQAAGTWTGTTTVLNNTIFLVNSASGLDIFPTNSPLIVGTGGTFSASSVGSMPIASLSDQVGGGGGTMIMGNVGGDQMSIGSDGTNTTFSGVFTGLDPRDTGGVIKVGTGTLTLTGSSSFNGFVTVQNGTLAFTTIGNAGDGVATSLMAPVAATDTNTTTAAQQATISIGKTTDTGTLRYIGTAASSSDRIINLAGTTGGATLDASGIDGANPPGTATLTLTSDLTATGVGAKTLTLTGTNVGANTLGGAIPDSTGGATSLAKTGSGNWIVSGASTYTGSTSVAGGKLSFQNNQLTTSDISASGTGAVLELATGGGNNRVIRTGTVAASSGGRIDLQDNKLIVTAQPVGTPTAGVYSDVSGLIQSGRTGGTWSGTGIVTSQASAVGGAALTTLGVDVASDVTGVSSGTTLWAGQTVNPTDTLVMYTYAGDANLDGKITGDDYFKIDSNYGTSNISYATGDFNYDGRIDADDYFIIDKNYAEQGSTVFPSAAPLTLEGVSAVPEPASLALLGLSTAGLFGRRRRHR